MVLTIRTKYDVGERVFLRSKAEDGLIIEDASLNEEIDFETGEKYYRIVYSTLTGDGRERDYYEDELI